MTLKTRRILYIFTIIAFFVIAPIVIALAMGVRFNFADRSIVQTGGLYLKTTPTSSLVNLAGKTSKKSPHELRFITPGNYVATITSSGYHEVSTAVMIKQQNVLRFDMIELLPKSSTKTISLKNVENIFLSPFGAEQILIQNAGESKQVLYSNEDDLNVLGSIEGSINKIYWHQAYNMAILFTDSSIYIVNEKTLYGPIENVHDAMVLSKDEIVIERNNAIYALNIISNETTVIHGQTTVYAVEKNNKQIFIKNTATVDEIHFKTVHSEKSEILRRVSHVTNITELPENVILIETDEGNFVFDFDTATFLELERNIEAWSINQEYLYFSTQFEVWDLNLKTFQKTFHNRFGFPFTNFSVTPKLSALLIPENNTVHVWYTTTQYPTEISISQPEDTSLLVFNLSNSKIRLFVTKGDQLDIEDFTL